LRAILPTYASGQWGIDGSSPPLLYWPDLRGRVTIGLDNMGGSDQGRVAMANTLGLGGGSNTISEAMLPAHAHTINHDHGSVTSGSPSITLTHYMDGDPGLRFTVTGGTQNFTSASGNQAVTFSDVDPHAAHTHLVNLPNYTGSSGNGAGNSAESLPPYALTNKIIRVC